MRQMFLRLLLIAGLALVGSPGAVLGQQSSNIPISEQLDNTLNQYCVVCHNDVLLIIHGFSCAPNRIECRDVKK